MPVKPTPPTRQKKERCFWCGKTFSEHLDKPLPNGAGVKTPCGILKSGFTPIGTENPIPSNPTPTTGAKKTKIHFEIKKADGMKGFAAYRVSPFKAKKQTILLNVYATFLSALEENIDPKELILTNLMHEFGHAMQNWLGMELSEEVVEKIVQSYADKYSEKSYEEVHGGQNE